MRILRLLVFLFGVATAVAAPAQIQETLPFTLKSLGHGVYAAIDDAKGDAGANAGFVIGDDGVLVVDTFENEQAARALLGEIRKLTPLPIRFVVNTHYHLDHVAGNRVFKEAGATIVAQHNVRDWIHTENLKFFGKEPKPEQKAEVANLFAPDAVYSSRIDLYLGNTKIEVVSWPGHTGGDSVVEIMADDAKNVVFCGDLFWRRTLPNLVDATTSEWIKTLNSLTLYVGLTFVPGHGDVGDGGDVIAFRQYLVELRQMVRGPARAGKDGDSLIASVMPSLEKKYGQWEFFSYFAKANILDAALELNGKKRVPRPIFLSSTDSSDAKTSLNANTRQ